MPLKGIKVSDSIKRITFKDYLPFKYEITDADIKYPVAVFKNFCKYVNSKYKAGVWGDQFLSKGDSSIVTLVYYVPIKFTKEEIEADVKAFENQYEDLKIEIKINTPQQEFNTYTDFKKGLLNQPWNLELAKKLFRLNWHSEPNLDDPDDQEELLILFNMNQESYHEYYVVDATMYFNIPDFAKNRIGEKNIDLHVYHVGDSKMKKDEDPRLELVDKIKNYSNEYEVLEYNLDDDYFIYDEIDYSFYTKNKKSFENWLKGLIIDVLDPREKKELNELIEDFNKENNIYPLNKIIDKFLYHFGFPGVPVLYANTAEGLKEAYEFVQERFDSDPSLNDSKQKQICDSFSKRYHTLTKDMPRLASIKRSAEVPLFLGYYNKGLVNDYNKSLEALIADLEYDLINFKNSPDYNSNIRNELKENYRPVYNICQKSTINPNLQNQFIQLYKNI